MFGNPKPSPPDVSKALSLLLHDSELYDGGATQEGYPALIGTLLVAVEVLCQTTLTDEQEAEALEHFVELYSCVTERDVPGAWSDYLAALTQMGDRLARLHETESPLEREHSEFDKQLASAGTRAAEIARGTAHLRRVLDEVDRGIDAREGYFEDAIRRMADGAAGLAAHLAKFAAHPAFTAATNPQGTSGGVEITEAVVEQAAAAAEAGYDVEQLKPRDDG